MTAEYHHRDGDRVLRFTRVERLAHWTNVTTFIFLLLTGPALLLWLRLGISYETRALLHTWHVGVGLAFFFGPALVFLVGDWRAGARHTAEAFRWHWGDLVWFLGPLGPVLGMSAPEVDRFNAGQRLNMLCQLLGKWGLMATGYLMHLRPGRLILHEIHLAIFFLLAVFVVGHMYMGVINPKTRHALRAMFTGYVAVQWLERHHGAWVKRLPHIRRGGKSRPSGKGEDPE